jgi:hypothetical protein
VHVVCATFLRHILMSGGDPKFQWFDNNPCTQNISLGESHQNHTEIEVLRSSRHFSVFVDATYLEALFS